jgi:hypothetical protein
MPFNSNTWTTSKTKTSKRTNSGAMMSRTKRTKSPTSKARFARLFHSTANRRSAYCTVDQNQRAGSAAKNSN